jgi:hypothetical protein
MTTRGSAEIVKATPDHPPRTFGHDPGELAAAWGSAVLRGASPAEREARLPGHEHPRSRFGVLALQFPGWQIDINPAGVGICTGYWCSTDGRSRRYVVSDTSQELFARLRAIGPMPS